MQWDDSDGFGGRGTTVEEPLSTPCAQDPELFFSGVRSKVEQASFPSTIDWNNWNNQSLSLPLQTGLNTIAYEVDAGDIGWLNFDALSLLKVLGGSSSPSTPTPTPTSTPG